MIVCFQQSKIELSMDSQSVGGISKNHDEKPEKFKGLDFKRWQQKMLFYLTTMNLAHIVREDVPKTDENLVTKETMLTIEAWKQSDFLCRNYILNRLDDTLYDIYSECKTAKKCLGIA